MYDDERRMIEAQIREVLRAGNLPELPLSWSWIPFSGEWGISTSVFAVAAAETKSRGEGNPRQRAEEIAQMLAGSLTLPSGFDRVEAVHGYLNFYFSTPDYSQTLIDTVLSRGAKYGWAEPRGKTAMVEFSQPNTHKAFHVGHLRNMILGAAVASILEAAGWQVIRANYVGDIGLHVVKWLWNYSTYHAGEQPPQEDKTRWMGALYEEADRRYEQSEDAQAQVRALFARWDRRDEDVVALWQLTREWSLEGFEEIYRLMGIRFDRAYFESEVEDAGKDLVKDLIARGIARDERPDGPVIVPLEELTGDKQDRVLVILRSDGTSLYATKDIPLAIKKFQEYHLDLSLYVVDVRQSLYLRQIFKTLELMGYPWAERCHHLAYELVNLPGNVTMSSREGTVVLIEDLVDEAMKRALAIVEGKNPELPADVKQEVAKAVALGALKYSMLSRDNTKLVTFVWEDALNINGQAAPYIQYAYVRANSILRRVGDEIPPPVRPTHELDSAEVQLINWISRFPDEVQRSAQEYRPLYIASAVYEIARAFNNFYMACPVLQAEDAVRAFRLRLVAAARQAIGNGLALLGISAPAVM